VTSDLISRPSPGECQDGVQIFRLEKTGKARMDEIKAGIKDAYFAWSGPTADRSTA
jgi:hypothetical protein